MTMSAYRVLFVCIGNAHRSQMAEGFAKTYGADVCQAASAGLSPINQVPAITLDVMSEKNIDLSRHFPKAITEVQPESYDLIVNMSGMPLPAVLTGRVPVRSWDVADPIGDSQALHRKVRDQIESLVMSLILEVRRKRALDAPRGAPPGGAAPPSGRRLGRA
jgi:protein-tyrosine-phosphatase